MCVCAPANDSFHHQGYHNPIIQFIKFYSPTPFLLLSGGGGGGGVGSGGGGGGWGLSERQTMGFRSSFGHMSDDISSSGA